MPLDPTETLFLRLQLALSRGQAADAEELLSRIEEKLDRGDTGAPPVDKIRRLIHEVEWHCILRNYSRKPLNLRTQLRSDRKLIMDIE